MLVYLFIFLLFLFQLDARLVVRDEKFDQRLHIGEWDWNIFIYFWQFQHLSYVALHFFQEAQDVYIDLSVRGCHFFGGARAAPRFPNLLHIWSLKVLYNWLHHIQYKTIPYHNHICCLGVFDAESFCWLRCQVLVLNFYQVLMISRQHCWQRFSQGDLEIPGWVVVIPIVVWWCKHSKRG